MDIMDTTPLETIHLHGTDLVLPRVGLGTWAIGGWKWGGTEESEAIATIRSAVERGIALIDTAPVYGFGVSESLVGRALAEGGLREHAIIATKTGLDWDRDGNVFRDASPKRIRREVEDSLRRLRTDRIDIHQVHWPDDRVPIEETAAEMAALLNEGKIRAIGVSNFSVAQMERFRSAAPIHAVQPPYNLFERGIERDILPYAARNGITILAYGPLCRGLLTGKIARAPIFKGDDLRKVDPKFQRPHLAHYLDAVAALDALAHQRHDRNVLALAVRWVLDQGPTVALWGARRRDQLDPVTDISGWRLDTADKREIDAILDRFVPVPIGPEFMAPPHRAMAEV